MASSTNLDDLAGESLPMAHRVRHAVLWRSGSQIAGQLAMWASTFLVIRLLAPADYGLFAMTQVVITFAGLMNGYSFAGALVQADRIDEERVGQVFGILICLNFGLAAAQFAIAPLAAVYYRAPLVADMLRVQSLLHLTTPFIIMPQALLARRIDFRTQARANLVAAGLGALTAPLCAWAGLGVWTLVIAPLVMFFSRAIGLQLVGRWWVRPRFRFAGARAMLGIGGAMLASDIFWFIQTSSDTLIGGRVLDPHHLGLYTEGLFLTQILLNKFIPPLNEVAFPTYARLQGDRDAVARGFLKGTRLIMLAALPFYFGLAVTARPLVLCAMGPHWADAIPVVRCLALAMPFATLQILYSPATNGLGRAGTTASVSLAGAIVMPIAFLIAARHGPVAMAGAWVAGAPLVAVIASAVSLPVIGLRPLALVEAIAPALKAALIMALSVMLIDDALPAALGPGAQLALLVTAGVAIYAAALFAFSPQAIAEVRALATGRVATA